MSAVLSCGEVRVVVGFDPARARSIRRSFTVRGDAALDGKAAGAGMRARSYHASPGEITSVGAVHKTRR